MPQKKTRANAYYRERLKKERPDIYADLLDGKFANETEAFIKAGLRKPSTPLNALKRAWAKASPADKQAFLNDIGAVAFSRTAPASAPSPSAVSTVKASTAVYIPSPMKAAIQAVMVARKIKIGQVMIETGRNPLDASLGMALHRDTHVQKDLIDDLEKWLLAQPKP